MGTRATIIFKHPDFKEDIYFVYRGHDGYPENVSADINQALSSFNGRFSYAEVGRLVAHFIGTTFEPKAKCNSYEMTTGKHGDESYIYEVVWDDKNKAWWHFVSA